MGELILYKYDTARHCSIITAKIVQCHGFNLQNS